MSALFDAFTAPLWQIQGRDETFPINRFLCAGKNYSDHVREMGGDPRQTPPVFFTKWGQAYAPSGSTAPYPPQTEDYHHEVELVVAIGKAGSHIAVENAKSHIFGYAVGLDMTRRDLQNAAKEKGFPWDTSKNFDHAAPLGVLIPVETCGHVEEGRIWLKVNGEMRQDADVSHMTWSVEEIISRLSQYYALRPGDVIMTGTPAGVGPVKPGDEIIAGIDGLGEVRHTIAAR